MAKHITKLSSSVNCKNMQEKIRKNLALFSRRKVSVYSLRLKNRNHSYFFRKADIKLGEKIICVHLERSELSGLFVLRVNKNNLRIVSVFHRIL